VRRVGRENIEALEAGLIYNISQHALRIGCRVADGDQAGLDIGAFDENNDTFGYTGLTTPSVSRRTTYPPINQLGELLVDLRNRVVTIFAGAHVRPGIYPEGLGITHVNILRTIEAMYGLPKSGAQQPNAAGLGITDDKIITDVFEQVR
jgi:hypothetical protein